MQLLESIKPKRDIPRLIGYARYSICDLSTNYFEKNKHIEQLDKQKQSIHDKIKTMYRDILKECSTLFFKDVSLQSNDYSDKVMNLKEIYEKLEKCFSSLLNMKENRDKPRFYCREYKGMEYTKEFYLKDQILVEGYSTNSLPELNFGITLSDDALKIEVYFDFYCKDEEPLFCLPVSEYELFCQFAYYAYDYIKSHTLTYSSNTKEIKEIRAYYKSLVKQFEHYIKERNQEHFLNLFDPFQFSASKIRPIFDNKSELQNIVIGLLKKLRNNINPNASEKKLYRCILNDLNSYRIIPRTVSYDFVIKNKNEETIDKWASFHIYVDLILKDNNKELELSLWSDEYHQEKGIKYYETYIVPLAQYTLLPTFMNELCEYWFLHSDSYYQTVEKTQTEKGVTQRWQENVPRKQEIKKIFIKIAKKVFCEKEETEELTLTPEKFKYIMRKIEYPDSIVANLVDSSYSEIIEVNGIKQLILSTGIDAVHIQLAITFNETLTELEVYLNEKTNPSDEPLFVLNSFDYHFLESFFATLKEEQNRLFSHKNTNKHSRSVSKQTKIKRLIGRKNTS